MMTEELLYKIAEGRARTLGFHRYNISARNYTIPGQGSREIKSFFQHHYIIDCPVGISVESYLGEYDLNNPLKEEQVTEHNGVINIVNHNDESLTVTFLVLILQMDTNKDQIAVIRLTERQIEEAEKLGLNPSQFLAFKLGVLKRIGNLPTIKISNPVGVFKLTREMCEECNLKQVTPNEYVKRLVK